MNLRCASCGHALKKRVSAPVRIVGVFRPDVAGEINGPFVRRRCRSCGFVNVFEALGLEQGAPQLVSQSSTIQLTQNQIAIVDASDWPNLRRDKWYAQWNPKTESFYAQRGAVVLGRTTIESMHRRILGLTPGDGLEVDHKNHDTIDNRRSNLRVVTRRGNAENQRNQSKYGPGIKKDRRLRTRPFVARAQVEGRTIHIGCYANVEEAREARERFLRQKGLDFAGQSKQRPVG